MQVNGLQKVEEQVLLVIKTVEQDIIVPVMEQKMHVLLENIHLMLQRQVLLHVLTVVQVTILVQVQVVAHKILQPIAGEEAQPLTLVRVVVQDTVFQMVHVRHVHQRLLQGHGLDYLQRRDGGRHGHVPLIDRSASEPGEPCETGGRTAGRKTSRPFFNRGRPATSRGTDARDCFRRTTCT